MLTEISFLISGLSLGATAALSPGPLQMLLISETLQYDFKAGIKVAFAPILTDAPIVVLTIFVLSRLANFDLILALITFAGAGFLGYLAYGNFTVKMPELKDNNVKPQSLKKAFITNFLNPHPYLFWFSVGAPMFIKGFQASMVTALLFLFGFYMTIISTLCLIAFFIDRFQILQKGKIYILVMRILGIILLVFALIFIRSGLSYSGIDWLGLN